MISAGVRYGGLRHRVSLQPEEDRRRADDQLRVRRQGRKGAQDESCRSAEPVRLISSADW